MAIAYGRIPRTPSSIAAPSSMRAAVGPNLPDQALPTARPVNAHLFAVKMRLLTITAVCHSIRWRHSD